MGAQVQLWHLHASASGASSPRLAACFGALGLNVIGLPGLAALREAVRQSSTGPALAVLAANATDNCAACILLRRRFPALGILLVCEGHVTADIVRQLGCGADAYCHSASAPELLLAQAQRLWTASGRSAPPAAEWSMRDEGWALHAPTGVQVSLTPGERAFLQVLMAAPDGRAPHADLLHAVNQTYGRRGPDPHMQRLGMLVSRLRRKLDAQGVSLPLRSVHRWGYQWAGTLPREQVASQSGRGAACTTMLSR
ncbi:MAG: hypothetical protein WCY98_09450 [Castellaniella sp.]